MTNSYQQEAEQVATALDNKLKDFILDLGSEINDEITYIETEIDIPVTITWNDNNDSDGNRPSNVTIRLYADGIEVDSHVCSSAESWSYTFTDVPRYTEQDDEIIYSLNTDHISQYLTSIINYNITCNYTPEETSKSVRVVWDDDNDAQKVRPSSVAVSLSVNGTQKQVEILNESNGWTSTVDYLPTMVNGMTATYTWTPQSLLEYNLTNTQETNNTTVFTYAPVVIPPPEGGKTPKPPWTPIEDEYDEPL